MSDYKIYPPGTKVIIKASGEKGEAFESAFGFITVFVGNEERPRYYKLEDVEFIEEGENCSK